MKYLYKGIVLFFVFCGALLFFGNNLAGNFFDSTKSVVLGAESFPTMTLSIDGLQMNRLYGYSGSIDPAIVRQSITPLGQSKDLTIHISEKSKEITKLSYQIIDKESKEVYEEKALNALEKNQKKVVFHFDYAFETSKEYILELMATTEDGERIYYYTRLKYYLDNTNLDKKMSFAMNFHEATFSKDDFKPMADYLETKAVQTDDSLAKVTIASSSDLITWGSLDPKVTSKIVPTIKEYNTETACVQLNYFIQAKTKSGKVSYHVKEFFRVRYTASRVFLLNYERSMEALFDPALSANTESEIKLGITSKTDMDMVNSDNGKEMYFARDGALYFYDMNKNTMNQIYNVYSNNPAEEYRLNDENDIRINKLDANGNLFFTSYGYIQRGEYEGKVAIVLYKYVKESGQVEELVYLPLDTTYQKLKEDFQTYSYVNSKEVYFFTVSNIAYSYNILSKRLEVIVENVNDSSFVFLKNKSSYGWSSNLQKGYGSSITIYNLETDEKRLIKTPDSNTAVRLLGTIDSNVICGYVKRTDIRKTKDGTPIVPCYKMEIVDNNGKVLKKYQRRDKYIANITVEGNVLTMERLRKSATGGYRKASTDSILNQESAKKLKVSLVPGIINGLKEWYIKLPSGYVHSKAPSLVHLDRAIVTSERAVHLEDNKTSKYYVYALGQITGAYENAAQAIQMADQQMGVVISSKHQIVWERSGSFLLNSISGVEIKKADSQVSSIAACAYMLLKVNHYDIDAKELSKSKKPLYDMIAKYLEKPVNLTGATLEEVLYFVSNGKPVIGMTGHSNAVVISGYTQTSITVVNPNSGKEETIGIDQAAQMFKNAGYRFVSYMQ